MMLSSNSKSFTIGPALGTGIHTAQLLLAEDYYSGDVQVTISVNGVQLGGVQTVTAQQANGGQELFTLNGNWVGTPTVSINFLNDAWNGSTGNGNDRNLYVDGISYDGVTVSSAIRSVLWSGPIYLSTKPVARVADFLSTIGVTTHLLYGDTSYHNETMVLASLAYLGIDHVRDGGSMLDPNAVLPFERAMTAGITFDFTASPDGGVANNIARLKTLVAADPGGISSIEGINEVSASFAYGGLTGQAAALKFQQDLFAAVKADPALAAIPVINYTVLSQDPADYTRFGDVSAAADLGNIHLYPYGGLQTQTSTLLPRELQGTPHSAGYVITEFGYDTMLNAPDIQAKYVLDGLLDAYHAGASATYIYELLDDNPDPGMTNVENHFGLFNADGSTKPAATALHNLTAILADPDGAAGSFTPRTLGYAVTGLPATGDSLLLARSDGSFDLAVWAEPQIRASPTSLAEIAAPSSLVTISFDQLQKSLLVYDPLLGPSPLATYTNVNSVTLAITDHPLILKIVRSIDTTAPQLILSENLSGLINKNSVNISGIAADKDSGVRLVEIYDTTLSRKIDLGPAQVRNDGQWTFTAAGLSDGTHQFSAIAIDNAGNSTEQVSAGAAVNIDTVKPSPIISTITGNTDGGVTLSGTSEPNSIVSLSKITGSLKTDFGSTTVLNSGRWQVTNHDRISMAQVSDFTVQGQDQAGNVGSTLETLKLLSNGYDKISLQAGVSEIISIMSSSGKDVISNFMTSQSNSSNHDFINFSGRGISSFEQVKSIISGTSSAIITLGSGKTITLENVLPSSLTRADFTFS